MFSKPLKPSFLEYTSFPPTTVLENRESFICPHLVVRFDHDFIVSTCKRHLVVPAPDMALACSCAVCPLLQPDVVFFSKSFLKAVKLSGDTGSQYREY